MRTPKIPRWLLRNLPEEPSELIKEIELDPVKEARKGGRKPSPPAEVETTGPEADVSTADVIEEENKIITEEKIEDEPSPVETVPAEESPDELIPQSAEERDEDRGDEQEYSVTVVNEISMDPQSSDLPSERDEIEYNPLLPVVVDAPAVSMESERGDESEPSEEDDSDSGTAKSTAESQTQSSSPAAPTAPAITEAEAITDPSENEERTDIDSEDLEELYVDSTGKLIIELQGTGWIYISSEGNDSLSLKNKSYNPGSGTTRFVFTSSSSGSPEGKLVFMKQDLLRGESSQKSLNLEGRLSTVSEPDSRKGADSATSDMVIEPDPEDSAAPESSSTAAQPEASKPSEQNGSEVFTADSVDPEEELPEDAAGLLRLAERYEAPGPDQSLEKALELYNRIKIEFPVTEERFIAETRIRYLNKHYFKVQ